MDNLALSHARPCAPPSPTLPPFPSPSSPLPDHVPAQMCVCGGACWASQRLVLLLLCHSAGSREEEKEENCIRPGLSTSIGHAGWQPTSGEAGTVCMKKGGRSGGMEEHKTWHAFLFSIFFSLFSFLFFLPFVTSNRPSGQSILFLFIWGGVWGDKQCLLALIVKGKQRLLPLMKCRQQALP